MRHQSFRHPKNFAMVTALLTKYARRFFVKIEQVSYQHNHIHILARSNRRSSFHNFFRVFAGQIAQNLKVTDTLRKIILWDGRPFSRIIRGLKNHQIARNYIQLNEKEVTGAILYKKDRLKGLSLDKINALWI